MEKKSTGQNQSSLPEHIIDLGNFTLELQKKIEQANLLDGKTGHKFIFKTASLNLVLPENQPAEIIAKPAICSIPNTPEWFVGMINLRGNLLPVFDLDGLLTGYDSENFSWLMVLGNNDDSMFAICIETLPVSMEFNTVTETGNVDIPELLRGHIAGAYSDNGTIWLEPDYESLMSEIPMHF